MLTVEERLRLCHQGTAWMGTLIEKQLRELADDNNNGPSCVYYGIVITW